MATTKRRKQWPRRRARVMRVTADTVGPGGSGGTRTGSSPMAPPQAGQCRASPSGEDAATSVGLCVPRPTPARAISAARSSSPTRMREIAPPPSFRHPRRVRSLHELCLLHTQVPTSSGHRGRRRRCRRRRCMCSDARSAGQGARAWELGHTRDTEPPRCMTQLLKIDLGLRQGFDADGHEIPMPILCAWVPEIPAQRCRAARQNVCLDGTQR